jgi:Ca-activated chloride channel family protein
MNFEWPWLLLLLLLVPVLAALYIWVQRQRKAYAVRFTNLELLKAVAGNPGFKRHIPPLLFLIGTTALLLALARPVASVTLPRERTMVMLVMDVSFSMQADDLKPTRFAAAKNAAKQLLQRLPRQVAVGLVSFSAKANLNAPLTTDHNAVIAAIDSLALDNGTAIGTGLAEALDHIALQNNNANAPTPAIIILLSDGESQQGVAPLDVAARATEMRIEVNTVGIGQRGARTKITPNQVVGLDEVTLQAIAARSGGDYFYAAQSSELESIYRDFSAQLSWVRQKSEVTAIFAGVGALLMVASALLSLRWFQQFP